jgi:hypothetical protein
MPLLRPKPFLATTLSPQLLFYSVAAETLSSVQGEIEELSVAAEGDYRCPFSFVFYHLLVTEHALVGSLATTEVPLK